MNMRDYEEVVPNDDEIKKKKKTASYVVRRISKEISKYPEVVGTELGGSYAKGTWLAGEMDIDVFVKFDRDVPDECFRSISRRIGFDSMAKHNPNERYADHPYVEAQVDNTTINVVPCYDVEYGGWKSAADRSPYHTRFMCERLTDSLRNDVRLLKKLLKVRGIYGAQMAIRGFSGYAAEVIVLHFGGFEETIRNIADIKCGAIIGETTRKFDTPISIIDPIDENRNLAAAISNRNAALFILACRGIVENPGAGLLGPKSMKPHLEWDNVVSVKFGRGDENSEVIWGQMRRAASAMIRQMELGGFVIIRHKVLVSRDYVHLLFLTESPRIPDKIVQVGPDIFRRDESAKFAGDGGMVWVSSDMRLRRIEKRTHHTAGALLRHILRNPERAGIPAGLHSHIRKGASVTVGGRVAQSVKEEAAELVCADEAAFYSA